MTYDAKMPVVPFRIDSEIKDALRVIAKKHDKSVQVLVREIIYEYLQDKGYITVTQKVNI